MNHQLAEVASLLSFFSKPQPQQWREIPDEMPKVWLNMGDIDCSTDEPIAFLSMILVVLLERAPDPQTDEAAAIFHEIRRVMWFMIENPNTQIFSKRQEPDDIDYVWGALARLCRIALTHPILAPHLQTKPGLGYFIEKYGAPIRS